MINPELVNELKELDFDVIKMSKAYRINGCIDIYYDGRLLYDKVENKYHKFEKSKQLLNEAYKRATFYGKREAFKKTENGRMTMKEYKHIPQKPIAEYYHFNNDKKHSNSHLYFIKSGVYIKIGKSINPKRRLRQLSTSSPEKPEIMLVIENKGHLEKTFHKIFKDHRIRHNSEWFLYCKRIIDFINYVIANKK